MIPVVAHVVVAGEIGGAERMLVDLATRPEATGARHVVALFTPNEGLARLFARAGIRTIDRGRVGEGAAAYLARSLGPLDVWWLSQVLVRERAKIVHLHTFGSQVLGTRAAEKLGLPIVRTEHSTRVYTDPTCWPFSRWSLRRADTVVAISQHVREIALLRAPWADEKIRVIPNGVDTERFRPQPSAAAEGPVRLCIVGRLEPRKGVDLAIRALADVPNATLDVVGDGQERERLEAMAQGLGERVTFHGALDDVRPVVARCEAFVSSSREEGLGIAVLEAMAMGKPTVALPVGGLREIVLHGTTGWLASGTDSDALAAVLRRAVAARPELAARGEAARTRVVEHFSIDAFCRAYRTVYGELAGDPREGA